jgi:hypothetical protein
LAYQGEFLVNNPLDVKENDEHALDFPLHLSRPFQSRQIWAFPLRGLLLCLRVIAVNPALITSDNPGQEWCVIGGELMQLLVDAGMLPTSDQLSEIASGQIHDSK